MWDQCQHHPPLHPLLNEGCLNGARVYMGVYVCIIPFFVFAVLVVRSRQALPHRHLLHHWSRTPQGASAVLHSPLRPQSPPPRWTEGGLSACSIARSLTDLEISAKRARWKNGIFLKLCLLKCHFLNSSRTRQFITKFPHYTMYVKWVVWWINIALFFQSNILGSGHHSISLQPYESHSSCKFFIRTAQNE